MLKLIESPSVDREQIEHFSRLADQWWDPAGKFGVLHKFNPVRLEYILSIISQNFAIEGDGVKSLEAMKVLDIGCGGGLLCEPLARLGAKVTGIDASARNIEIARAHAKKSGVKIDYRVMSIEELAASGESFDIVLNMEVIEHVNNVAGFMASC